MKAVSIISALIFAIVAVMHVIRYFNGWVITVNGTDIPLWISIPGAVVPAILAVLLLCDCGKKTSVNR